MGLGRLRIDRQESPIGRGGFGQAAEIGQHSCPAEPDLGRARSERGGLAIGGLGRGEIAELVERVRPSRQRADMSGVERQGPVIADERIGEAALERSQQVAIARRVALGEMGVMTVGVLLILTLALRAYQTGA